MFKVIENLFDFFSCFVSSKTDSFVPLTKFAPSLEYVAANMNQIKKKKSEKSEKSKKSKKRRRKK
jgi:hypothetical protein